MKKLLLILIVVTNMVGNAQCWQSVTAGGATAHGVKNDGSLWGWGSNGIGQVGDGTTTDKNIPTRIGVATNWQFINLLNVHSLALKNDGSLWAFGGNTYGQLGDASLANKSEPTAIAAGTTWRSVSAGVYHSAGVKTDGSLYAWGRNQYGEVGDGTLAIKTSPVQIGTATDWHSVSAGWNYTLAVKTNGTLWAWGRNNKGQLADGTIINKLTPIQVGTDSNWSKVVAGWGFTVALKTDGTIWIWGGYSGEFSPSHIPVQIGSDNDWQFISGGDDHYAAIKTNGTLWASGENGNGQLGNGTTINESGLVQIGTASNWQTVFASGYLYTIATDIDSNLLTWGDNSTGELGNGSNVNSLIPLSILCPSLQIENFDEIRIVLSPNPATDIMNIQNNSNLKIERITISDMGGRQIIENIGNVENIDVQQLSPSMYIVEVKISGKVIRGKFIKD